MKLRQNNAPNWAEISSKSFHSFVFFPIGGIGKFGMNLLVLVYRGKYFVFDCGALFPDAYILGVDKVVPKLPSDFVSFFGNPSAYLISHGHEDHIGSLPTFLENYPAPVYATGWTYELIMRKIAKFPRLSGSVINKITPDTPLDIGGGKFQWLPTDHSIPSACMLMAKFDEFNLLFTGDFRFGNKMKSHVLDKIFPDFYRSKIDIVFCDSTNSDKDGFCPEESRTLGAIEDEIKKANGCVFVTTFSSNFERLSGIIDFSAKLGKRVHICGRGLLESLEVGYQFGWKPPHHCLAEVSELPLIPREDLVILITGCQADYMSALKRLAEQPFRGLTLTPGDTVIFSSRFIPGNEKNLYDLIASLEWQGIRVITPKVNPLIHSSGHAYKGDILELINRTGPLTFIPVHGSYSHLLSNAALSRDFLQEAKLELIQNGGIYSYTNKSVSKLSNFEPESIFIDSESNGQMTYETMRKRMRIGEKGLVVVSGVYNISSKRWIKEPISELIGIGFPNGNSFEKCSNQISASIKEVIASSISSDLRSNIEDLNEAIRIQVRRVLFKNLNRKPETYCYLHLIE